MKNTEADVALPESVLFEGSRPGSGATARHFRANLIANHRANGRLTPAARRQLQQLENELGPSAQGQRVLAANGVRRAGARTVAKPPSRRGAAAAPAAARVARKTAAKKTAAVRSVPKRTPRRG